MLEGIDKIEWSSLKHAYGQASDVPENIRNLVSPDIEKREKAYIKIYGNIFHQGSRYEATSYAIPFIYELIESELVPDKHKLIYLLVNLALGYEEEYLPMGFNPSSFRTNLRKREAGFTIEQKTRNRKVGYSTEAIINCYDAVLSGIRILYTQLKNQDQQIRIASTYAISWFPEVAAKSLPKLIDSLNQSNDEIETANTILAIGLLNRQSKEVLDLAVIEQYLESNSDLERICSAISLTNTPISKLVLKTLVDGILNGQKLEHNNLIRFNEGSLSGYASISLSHYGKENEPKACSDDDHRLEA